MAQRLSKIVADFSTSLATKVAVGGTSATLQSATDSDGNALSAGQYIFTIDGDSSLKEYWLCDVSSTAVTNIQNISRQGTLSSGSVREHRIGASVKITNFAHIKFINDLLDGTTGFDTGTKIGYAGDPSLNVGDTYKFSTIDYVNGVAIAGGADASTSVKGISKMSTAPASATNPIAVGDNDPRVPTQDENDALAGTSGTPSTSNKFVTNDDTSATAAANKVVRADGSNKIAEGYLNITNANATTLTDGSDATSLHSHTQIVTCSASDTAQQSADTERSESGAAYAKHKEINMRIAGGIRVKFDLKTSSGGNTVYGRIYVNGVATGTEQSTASATYATYSEDLTGIQVDDDVQLYLKGDGVNSAVARNFRITYTPAASTTYGEVVTD